jgi:hypothetical protein
LDENLNEPYIKGSTKSSQVDIEMSHHEHTDEVPVSLDLVDVHKHSKQKPVKIGEPVKKVNKDDVDVLATHPYEVIYEHNPRTNRKLKKLK